MRILQVSAAFLVGTYLALAPLLQPLFVVHNSKCVCHQPFRLLESRVKSVVDRIQNQEENVP